MGSTALQIAAAACNDANLYASLTSFTSTDPVMQSIINCINMAIADMNRAGSYSFCEQSTLLTYTAGVNSYDLNMVGITDIEPRRIIQVRREVPTNAGKLSQYNWVDFQRFFRNSTVPTGTPRSWSKFGSTLYLDNFPDQDYQITLYYYQQIQPIVPGQNDNNETVIPSYHEDVLRSLTKAYILQLIKSPDFGNEYTLAMNRVKSLVARSAEDVGMPQQMPRGF